MRARTHTHTHSSVHAHTLTRSRAHTHTRTHTHTHTHTHTCARAHSRWRILLSMWKSTNSSCHWVWIKISKTKVSNCSAKQRVTISRFSQVLRKSEWKSLHIVFQLADFLLTSLFCVFFQSFFCSFFPQPSVRQAKASKFSVTAVSFQSSGNTAWTRISLWLMDTNGRACNAWLLRSCTVVSEKSDVKRQIVSLSSECTSARWPGTFTCKHTHSYTRARVSARARTRAHTYTRASSHSQAHNTNKQSNKQANQPNPCR